ncbi:MAG TPA: hypothetical protein VF141_18450 [Chryseolinea sp.]
MAKKDLEELYIRSLDAPMTSHEQEFLTESLTANTDVAADLSKHLKIREVLLRSTPATFGPFFSIKIVNKIQNVGIQIDRQIIAFFKKYQLAMVGVVVALLALNAVFADQLTFQTLFGLEDAAEEIVSFDFYETFNSDL